MEKCCFCDKDTIEAYPTNGYWSAEEERAGNGIKYVCCPECYNKVVRPEVSRKQEYYED